LESVAGRIKAALEHWVIGVKKSGGERSKFSVRKFPDVAIQTGDITILYN
jgi:hypothetical protein